MIICIKSKVNANGTKARMLDLREPMYYILLALTEECCGVDIMEKVRQISDGRVKVGPGTLYAMLSRFEENDVIRKTAEEGRRKHYDDGRKKSQRATVDGYGGSHGRTEKSTRTVL